LKLYLDSADLDEIRAAAAAGWIDGVTMNPALLSRANADLESLVPAVGALVDGPVCVPAQGGDPDAIVRDGRALAKLHDSVVVKVAIDPVGLRALAKLHSEGIRTHATLCCSLNQALLAAHAGADYVSPIVGRLEESGQPGMVLVSQIIDVYDNYDYDTQIVVASLRTPEHVQESALLGADAVTVRPALLEQMLQHPLTSRIQGEFLAAWKRGS
jgi:transaldolase